MFWVAASSIACGEDPDDGPLKLNPTNHLSVLVSFEASGATEARVVYESETGESGATPFEEVGEGPQEIATLGHLPNTAYTFTVELRGPDGTTAEEIGELSTGSIPPELDPLAPGCTGTLTYPYVLLTYKSFIVAIDEQGRIRWYRSIDGVLGRDAGQVANDHFVAFIGETTGAEALPGHYVEFTPAGDIVREYHAPDGLFFDNHELILTDLDAPTPTSHFFTILPQEVDLTDQGGPASATVVGHQIIRMKNGAVDFRWDAIDHLPVDGATALIPDFLERCADACDYDHPNSLQITPDGNYLASWAVLSELTKIDSTTGDVLWRLGGKYNQFEFVDDPLQGFGGQHYARILDNGHLLLYDNGHNHEEEGSRAVEYVLDETAKTATLVWEHRATPPLYTLIVGSAVRLENGNTFVGFTGNVDFTSDIDGPEKMVEVDTNGVEQWSADIHTPDQPFFYRALPIPSLYEYVKP